MDLRPAFSYPLRRPPYPRTMTRLVGLIGYALEFLLMPLKVALKQPIALVLLGSTLALVVGMLTLRQFDAVAHRAPWLLGWGLLAYAVAVVVLACCEPDVRAPELRQVRGVRGNIARLRRGVQYERAAAAPFIAEALEHLDEHLVPALRQLLMSAQGLAEYLSRYDPSIPAPSRRGGSSGLPSPDPAVLERVRGTYQRQREAIEECVREVANAEAALVSLLAAGDNTDLGTRARAWSNQLLDLYDPLIQALHGDPPAAPLPPPTPAPAPAIPVLPAIEDEAWEHVTEEALKVMNNHFALAKCGLLEMLPSTLAAIRSGWGASRLPGATPLEQAQALHEVLAQAIERLKPVDGSDKGEPALRYNIVRERYLEGKEVKQIYMRRDVSERTFHRYRRDGTRAIAQELRDQEHRLARDRGSDAAFG